MKYIVLFSALLLAGCATTKTMTVKTIPVERAPLSVPKPDTLRLRDTKWIVITKDNFESIMAELEKSGKPLVLFALTEDGLQALRLNMADIKKLIEQQKTIIAAYEDYYKNGKATPKTGKKK